MIGLNSCPLVCHFIIFKLSKRNADTLAANKLLKNSFSCKMNATYHKFIGTIDFVELGLPYTQWEYRTRDRIHQTPFLQTDQCPEAQRALRLVSGSGQWKIVKIDQIVHLQNAKYTL